ncbi:hypothetical protein [Microbacterium invictum]|uniref:Solute-binding protein family 3/N-terminal domain-containing protein n=1 Tax=Microbacterium invictum TaxID=515415 RepID=A0AA40SM31_9MICO|nr:hypothetical protein [Microbacterium invictum]MBB4138728.1 hypothetical protein [Microbacterium invictum]
MGRRGRGTVVGVLVLALAGCAVPVDPDGTLERIGTGIVRVGASPSGSLVVIDDGDVSGELADLVTGFASARGASVEWTVGSEEELVTALEDGLLDLAIGGMTDSTPWIDRASATRGYSGIRGAGDAAVVVLLPLGENGTQAALEHYLDEAVAP